MKASISNHVCVAQCNGSKSACNLLVCVCTLVLVSAGQGYPVDFVCKAGSWISKFRACLILS